MKPLVSIITLVNNEIATLQHSVPLIFEQDFEFPYEMIIIDSGSNDGSVKFVQNQMKNYQNLRHHQIVPDTFHHARTRNLGAELAKGKYLVFLGGDALPVGQKWLNNLVQPVMNNEDEKTFASYGRQLPRVDADISNLCRMGFNYGESSHVKNSGSNLTRQDLFYFSSVNCCINKEKVEFPLFDDQSAVNEDNTLSYRMINEGNSIAYVADAPVIHSHNYSAWEIFQRYFDNAVTYKKIGIHKGVDKSMNDDGKRYLAFSLSILKKKLPFDWIRFFWFTSFAVVGAKLGQNYKRLPAWIVSRCSKYDVA